MLNLHKPATPSQMIQKRSEGMRAVKYDSGEKTISFEVGLIGSEPEDFVSFDLKRGVAMCSRLADGLLCDANKNGQLCCHVWAASLELEAENKRNGKEAA
jgi:hypothetical protein